MKRSSSQDNNLYGTTIAGNGSNGTVFELVPNGTMVNPRLAAFNNSNGSYANVSKLGRDAEPL